MAKRNDAQREEQVVDQAEHGRQPERPVAEAEPEIKEDGAPTREDGVQGPVLRFPGELTVEILQPLRLRPGSEGCLRGFQHFSRSS